MTVSTERGQVPTEFRLMNEDDDGPSWLDSLAVVGEHKRLFIPIVVLGMALSLTWAMVMPRQFVASTVVLPAQPQQGSSLGALAQLGNLAGMAGAISSVKTPDELFVALLGTRRLQDALIDKFQLTTKYEVQDKDAARKMLSGSVSASIDKKSGLITIEVSDRDAQFAANLANAHVSELRKILGTIAITEAQQRRAFLDLEVKKVKDALNAAEIAFRSAQVESGWNASNVLAEAGSRSNVELRGKLAAARIRRESALKFVTPQNQEVQRLSAEIDSMERQLREIEGGTGRKFENNRESQKAVQSYRDMKVYEATLEVLLKQLQLAKMEEAKEGPSLQQVDPAVPPERQTKPRRFTVALMGTIASLLAGLTVVFLRASISPQNERNAKSWLRFRQAWLRF